MFKFGLPWHTFAYLEQQMARWLPLTQGKMWAWTGPGEEVGGWWDGIEQFIEFDGPFIYQSWLYWKNWP